MRSRRQQVSLAGLGLGPVYETLVVELGGDGHPPVQKRQGGGKRDVRRYLLPNGVLEVRVHLYHQRGWRISDDVVPGVTEERIVPLRDLVDQLATSAAAPPPPAPDRREFLGNFRHPTAEDLQERAANIEREDAEGLLGLWEWCKLPETQDPGSLSPDMWAVYSADNNQEIEQAFRDGVMFEGALGSGKQVDTRHKKRRFVRRRAVSAEEREASFQAAESVVASDPTFADQDCAICAESFADTPTLPVVELPCQHRFHGACVQDLKDRRKTCPICRAEVDWRVVREVQMLPATNAVVDDPPPPPPPGPPVDSI